MGLYTLYSVHHTLWSSKNPPKHWLLPVEITPRLKSLAKMKQRITGIHPYPSILYSWRLQSRQYSRADGCNVTMGLVLCSEIYWSVVPEDLVYNLKVLTSTGIFKISNIVSPSDWRVVGQLSVSYNAILCLRFSRLVMESQRIVAVLICQSSEQPLKRILALKNGLLSREQLELW